MGSREDTVDQHRRGDLAFFKYLGIVNCRDHCSAMIERFLTTINMRMSGKAVHSIAGNFAPSSEFITDDIIIDNIVYCVLVACLRIFTP